MQKAGSIKLWIFRIIAIALSLSAVFLTGELVIRMIYAREARGGDLQQRLERSKQTTLSKDQGDLNMSGLVQASSVADIVYEAKPNLNGSFRGHPIQTSSQGLRDRDYDLTKHDGVYRIVGLGDSVMFGWGVGQGECYLDLLEEKLNSAPVESNRRYEVINFALPGYNTTMEVATFEHKALQFDPDLVIIQFVNNDFGAPIFMQRPRDLRALDRSYFAEFIQTRMGWWDNRKQDGVMGDGALVSDRHEEAREVSDQYSHMVGSEAYRNAMEKLAELTSARGIPVIVLLGSRSSRQDRIVKKVAARHGFHLLEIKPYTDRFLAAKGIGDNPAERQKAIWVSKADHHPNAEAHTIYVEGLMDKLREIGVLGNE